MRLRILRMLCHGTSGCAGELGVAVYRLGGSFADYDEAHDDSLLYVIDVIRKTGLAHTGCASASTLARNFSGRSPGVSTSTFTPSSDFSSSCKSPKCKSVAPGNASTSRSRSLPS